MGGEICSPFFFFFLFLLSFNYSCVPLSCPLRGESEDWSSVYTFFFSAEQVFNAFLPGAWTTWTTASLGFRLNCVTSESNRGRLEGVCIPVYQLGMFLSFFFKNYFIIVQLQFSAFSSHPSTPPQPNPPTSPASTLPLVLSMCPSSILFLTFF